MMSTAIINLPGLVTALLALVWGLLLLRFARAARRSQALPALTPFPAPSLSSDPRVPPGVSVVIAARNEAAALGPTLDRLLAADRPRGRFEIIVADDRSTDGTGEVVAAAARASDGIVRGVRIETVPPGWTPKKWAVHQGIAAAGGELILTTDADCRVGEQWLDRMTAPFNLPGGPDLVGGPVDYIGADAWPWPRRLLRLEFVALSLAAAGSLAAGIPLVISAQNMAFRRDLYERCGGHGAHAAIPSGDDVFLLFAAHAAGARTGYVLDPAAVVETAPPVTLRGFYHQRARWASKGTRYPRRPFLMSFLVWLLNAGLIALIAAAAAGAAPLWFWAAGALAVKGIGELALLSAGRRLGLQHLLIDYLTGLPLHLIYVTFIGLAGAAGFFRWKETT